MNRLFIALLMTFSLVGCGGDSGSNEPVASKAEFQVEAALKGLATLPSSWTANTTSGDSTQIQVTFAPLESDIGPGEGGFSISRRTVSETQDETLEDQFVYQLSPFRILRVTRAGRIFRSIEEPWPVPTTASVHVPRNSHRLFSGRVDPAPSSIRLLQSHAGSDPAVKLSPPPLPPSVDSYVIDLKLDARTEESAWFCLRSYPTELCFAIGLDGTALGPFRAARNGYAPAGNWINVSFVGGGTSTSSVSVYKSVGSRQCTQGGVSLSELKRQLTQAGIAVRRATCAFDGSKYPTVCGEPDGAIGILDVPVSQLADATRHGYALLSELTGPVQAGPCASGRD